MLIAFLQVRKRILATTLTAALLGAIAPNILTAAPNFTITDLPDGSVKVTADDAAEGDEFGEAVAISGDTVVIGARDDDDAGDASGAAYVFIRDSNGNWTQQAKLTADDAAEEDSFGWSVSLSGDTAIIGADLDDDAGMNSGSAYVFTRDGNGDWTQQDKLTATDAAAGDLFGSSVALSGDTAVIGALGDDDAGDDSGSAYVFTRDGNGDWTQQDKLTADDAAENDDFGESVAVSGDTVVVGAPANDDAGRRSGSAYVFTREGNGSWIQQRKLTADDAAEGDRFGVSVALSSNTAVVGAPGDDRDDGGTESGSAYVFTRDGGGNWTQQDKLTATDAGIGDFFGRSVALSSNTVVAGAHADDDAGAESGSAYVFMRDGNGNWTQQAKLTADDAAEDDVFGWFVAVSGNTAVVGAYWDDDAGIDSGSAYIYIIPFEADVNNDGIVSPADAIYVLNRLGTTDLSADVDGDGDIDRDDVDAVVNALGSTL